MMGWTPPAAAPKCRRGRGEGTTSTGSIRDAAGHDRRPRPREEPVPGARRRRAGPAGPQAPAGAREVLKRRLAREKVLEFFANLPPCLVGLEACAAAHYWARELTKLGHEVRLMPPQYVRPYVKTNKHDAADAEAICEAVTRPGMRFVPVKEEGRQALLMLHRVREQLLKQRTATIHAPRAPRAEFGIVAAQRRTGRRELLAVVADVEDRRRPPLAREPL